MKEDDGATPNPPNRSASVQSRMSRSERRAQILVSATAVFTEMGAGARVRDIAEVAGVNDALLYQHFRSKEELFEAAVIEPLDRAVAGMVNKAVELPIDPTGAAQYEAARSFMRDLLEVLCDSARLLTIVLASDRLSADSFYRDRFVPVIDVMVSMVERNLPLWSHRPFDPKIATKASFGMCWGLAMDQAFGFGEDIDVVAVADELTAILFFGLMPLAESAEDASRQP